MRSLLAWSLVLLALALSLACGRASPASDSNVIQAAANATPEAAATATAPPATETPTAPPPLDPSTLDVTAPNPLDEETTTARFWSGPKTYLVHLQANNGQYVGSSYQGRIVAEAPRGGPWETFLLVDFNGGRLWHDDWVALIAHNGLLTADWPDNFGRARWDLGFWIFQIKTCCGKIGQVVNGDRIHLAAAFPHWYRNQYDQWKWGTPFMSAVNGGGGNINYNREWPNIETWDWLIFRIWNAGGSTSSGQLQNFAQSNNLISSYKRGSDLLQQGQWLSATTPLIGNTGAALSNVTPLNNATP